MHVALSCATSAGAHAITDFLGGLRTLWGLSAERVDVQPPGHLLRLPGSVSLKPGGKHCVPVDEELRPMTAVAAAARVRAVLGDTPATVQGEFTRVDGQWCVKVAASTYQAGLSVEVRRRDGLTRRVELGEVARYAGEHVVARFDDTSTVVDPVRAARGVEALSSRAAQAHLRLVTDDDAHTGDSDRGGHVQWQAPRAWRPRTPLTAEQWRVLSDPGRGDRSAAATAAAWVLWNSGLRSFAAVRWYYTHLPAFAKFRDRDTDHQTAGSTRSACAAHWQSIVERARTYRPPIDPGDQDILTEALAAIATWDDPTLIAAGRAVIAHRFADGHGLTGRPIAKRDLAVWMSICDSRAYQHLRSLEDLGLLVCARAWADGPPCQATLWNLGAPVDIYRGDYAHDVTISQALPLHLHPLWGQVGHHAHLVWTYLQARSQPQHSRDLAQACGLPLGDARWGVGRLLRVLGELGLVTRTGVGRGTLWTVAGVQATLLELDRAAAQSGALERARELNARIVAERAVWHAEGPRERARMKSGLQVLRQRLTHRDIAGGDRDTLFTTLRTRPTAPTSGRVRRRRAGPGPQSPPGTRPDGG